MWIQPPPGTCPRCVWRLGSTYPRPATRSLWSSPCPGPPRVSVWYLDFSARNNNHFAYWGHFGCKTTYKVLTTRRTYPLVPVRSHLQINLLSIRPLLTCLSLAMASEDMKSPRCNLVTKHITWYWLWPRSSSPSTSAFRTCTSCHGQNNRHNGASYF